MNYLEKFCNVRENKLNQITSQLSWALIQVFSSTQILSLTQIFTYVCVFQQKHPLTNFKLIEAQVFQWINIVEFGLFWKLTQDQKIFNSTKKLNFNDFLEGNLSVFFINVSKKSSN